MQTYKDSYIKFLEADGQVHVYGHWRWWCHFCGEHGTGKITKTEAEIALYVHQELECRVHSVEVKTDSSKSVLTDLMTAVSLVARFMKDPEKTIFWFSTPNPMLGDIIPLDLIEIGHIKKLLQFIFSALHDN